MELLTLETPAFIETDKKVAQCHKTIGELLADASAHELSDEVVTLINAQVTAANAATGEVKEVRATLLKAKRGITNILIKKLKLVPKGHYRNIYMPLGMAGIGIPMGVAFGAAMDNMGLLGLGLPIGMMMGIVIGTLMDKKAADEGRQLSAGY